MPASPKFKVATAVKNYVISTQPYSTDLYEVGVNRMTDPELVLSQLEDLYGDEGVCKIVNDVLKLRPELKPLAQEIFSI